MAKTYEEILDEMCKRVKECSTMEGSFIYIALAPNAKELALLYMRLGRDEDYLLPEIKRTISDVFLIKPHIKSVEDVSVNKDLDKLNITCMVNTRYGDVYVKI